MMRLKRFVFIIMLLIGVGILTSCAKVTIYAEIAPDCTVKYRIQAHVDDSNMNDWQKEEAVKYINQVIFHLSKTHMGQPHYIENLDDEIIIDLAYEKSAELQPEYGGFNKYETSFAILMEHLTMETSPFSSFSYQIENGSNCLTYMIDTSINISNIVPCEVLESLSPQDKELVKKGLEELQVDVVFLLPYSEEYENPQVYSKEYKFKVNKNKKTDIHLEGQIFNGFLIQKEKQLENKLIDAKKRMLLCGSLLGLTVVTVIARIIILISKKIKR